MTLIHHRQQAIADVPPEELSPSTVKGFLSDYSEKACGASCILCAQAEIEAELDGIRVGIEPISDKAALDLYLDIVDVPGDVSVLPKVVSQCIKHNMDVTIIQDEDIINSMRNEHPKFFKVASDFDRYKNENSIPTEVKIKKLREFSNLKDMFSDYARFMIVVAFPVEEGGPYMMHWVLARYEKSEQNVASGFDETKISIMNPDGGQEHKVDDLWGWLQGKKAPTDMGGDVKKLGSESGAANYVFVGVALRLTHAGKPTLK